MLSLIFWVFLLILGLSYFGISIQSIINSPVGQENIAYVHSLLSQMWAQLAPVVQPVVDLIRNIKL